MADDMMSVHSDRSGNHRRSRSRSSRLGSSRGIQPTSDESSPMVIPTFSAAKSEGVARMDNNRDDNWAENTTVVTGNTSEHSYCEDSNRAMPYRLVDQDPLKPIVQMRCARSLWLLTAALVCISAVVSPLIMIILPKLPMIVTIDTDFDTWHTNECTVACQGQLMSIAFKLVLLLIGIWAVFGRRAVADLPRLFVARAALLALVFFVTFAYWLFYAVRIVLERSEDYAAVVAYAASLVDSLLFIHYLSVVLLELRHLRPEFKITIVRSPDGETRTISVGFLSIQRAAVDILRCYYKDFPLFNPFLDKLPGGASRMRLKGGGGSQVSGFKLYNLGDGVSSVGDGAGISEVNAKALMLAASKRRESGHNERFYEELDWERRVRKRRCRLLAAADESFAHVKRVDEHNEKALSEPMDAYSAAQAVFPGLAKQLHKYLRITRQQPRHTAEQVVEHLSQYLRLDMSARSFLQRFFTPALPVESAVLNAKWSIVCPYLVSRPIAHSTVFQLRCHSASGPDVGVQLLCTVSALPFFNLTEEGYPSVGDKFALRLSSETSV